MLRVHVVREGGHHYYVNDLVPGRAEGGLVAGEDPGTWIGSGSRPRLRGAVGFQGFRRGARRPRPGVGLRPPHPAG